MTAYVDLHLHTYYSDGSDVPAVVVGRAKELGFSAIAITDHDTVAGVEEGREAAAEAGIEFLTGTEISAKLGKSEVHILGFGIDPGHAGLLQALDKMRTARATRATAILERLKDTGIHLEPSQLEEAVASDGVVGRMHIAQQLVEVGAAKEVQEAFDRYLNPGRPAYVPKVRIAAKRAIELIHQAGGVAILAHPGIGAPRHILNPLLALPFDGLEAYHVQHSPGQVEAFLRIAQENNLLVSGGSDCHGGAKKAPEMGKVRVPYRHYERLREALAERHKP